MSSSRRFVAALVRLALVVLAIALVGRYFKNKFLAKHDTTMHIQREAPPPSEALGPGDMRIYSSDSAVDLVLSGNNILAGLSPKTVARVNDEIAKDNHDTSGFAGSITKIVKSSVAGAIGTHAVYSLSDIRDIRYEDGQIVFDAKDGKQHNLFGSTRVNGNKVSSSFRPEDAQKFVEAVRSRIGAPAER